MLIFGSPFPSWLGGFAKPSEILTGSIGGVAYLAHLMHIPEHYIVAIAVIMLGIGIVTGVQTTRHKDPS